MFELLHAMGWLCDDSTDRLEVRRPPSDEDGEKVWRDSLTSEMRACPSGLPLLLVIGAGTRSCPPYKASILFLHIPLSTLEDPPGEACAYGVLLSLFSFRFVTRLAAAVVLLVLLLP